MIQEYLEIARTSGHVSLPMGAIFDLGKKAVIRAYSFIGFGLNGINNPETSYRLEQLENTEDNLPSNYLLAELSGEHLDEAKSEFRRWIIGNGFSEYIHIMSIFCDKLYSLLLFLELLAKRKSLDEQLRREKNFHKKMSLNDKLELISSEMGIKSGMLDYIGALNKMRNCMIHNAGVVAPRYCNDINGLIVKWMGPRVYVELEGGEEVPAKPGYVIPAGSNVVMRLEEVSKTFLIGEIIDIKALEMFEIFMYAQLDLNQLGLSVDRFNETLAGETGAEALDETGEKKTWRFSTKRSDIEGVIP